jgi:PEGA domain
MRNSALSIGLSWLLIAIPFQSQPSGFSDVQQENQAQDQKASPPTQVQQTTSDAPKPSSPGQFVVQDGTPIKLRFSRNVSSADATVGESVDLEVLEEVMLNGVTVVPKSGTAIASVTEAVPKRRMGRAGKLEIVLDYVRLADNEKVPVRAVKEAKGGSHVGGMTVGIVATSLVFFPAAPLFLLMHGKDITIPKGAEVTAYVNGDLKLNPVKFIQAAASSGTDSTSVSTPAPPVVGSIEVHSVPDSAEVYADGSFMGNAPATLKLGPGQHTIRVSLNGFKEWSRDLTVQAGSDAHLTANLDKQD